jgi:hypothetical protein
VKKPNIFTKAKAAIGGALRKLWAAVKRIWQRLLNLNVPWKRGYLIVGLIALLAFSWIVVDRLYREKCLLEAIHQDPDSAEAYQGLMLLYWLEPWANRDKAVSQDLAAQYPDSPWPLIVLASKNLEWPFLYIPEESIELMDRVVELANDDESLYYPSVYFEIAREYEREAQVLQKRMAVAQEAERKEGLAAAVHFLGGQELKQAGNLDAAESEFAACAKLGGSSWWEENLCYIELVTATRKMTITLKTDHMVVQTLAEIDDPPEEVLSGLSHEDISAGYLVWGRTQLGPGMQEIGRASIELEPSKLIATTENKIGYDELWLEAYDYSPYEPLEFAIEDLPLASYITSTTITVIADGAKVVSATQSYATVHVDTFSWELSGSNAPGKPLGISIDPDDHVRRKLAFSTDSKMTVLPFALMYGVPTIWAIVALVIGRRAARYSSERELEKGNLIHRIFHLRSVFSWAFDLALLLLASQTVLYPVWLTVMEGTIPVIYYNVSLSIFDAYSGVLILLLLRLAVSRWREDQSQHLLIHPGAIAFACYLVPALYFSEIALVYFAIGAVVYYFVLVRGWRWTKELDWQKLKRLFSAERRLLVERIVSLDQLPILESTFHAQDVALAKGTLKATEYEASQRALEKIIERRKQMLNQLREEIGVPADKPLKALLFQLGPMFSPIKNGLIALGFGLLPFLAFMIAAAYQGEVEPIINWSSHSLLTTMGVPWGPMYLFFFGVFFRVLRGNYGVVKGLVFGGILALLRGLFEWIWMWDQTDGLALWGIAIRILVTFIFTGLMMDWMTVGFSLKRIRLSYNSPAFATVFTVAGGAVMTIVTGLVTGTMDRLLSIVLTGLSAAIGQEPPPSLGP